MLCTAALAALAVTAGPAAAAGQAAAAGSDVCNGWEAAGAGTFDSLSALTASASTARSAGDVTKEPSLNATYEAMPASAKGKGNAKFKATVPVWFHVISDGETGNVTQSEIDEPDGGAEHGFRRVLRRGEIGLQVRARRCDPDRQRGVVQRPRGGNAERDMKRTLHRGGFETLNVYTNTAGRYLGYAYLPGCRTRSCSRTGSSRIGSRCRARRRGSRDAYDLGFTLVHEAGHWFNLEHTFFGGCNAKGDFVDDTPAMKVPTSGCPDRQGHVPRARASTRSTTTWTTRTTCYNQFTAGQVARAQDAWLYFRAP